MDELFKSIGEMEQGRYPDAAVRLQAVIDDPRIAGISSTPDLIVFYHGLASAHAGDFRRAIEDFRTIRLRNDRHITHWRGPRLSFPSNDLTYMMATAAFRGGFMEEAIAGFHQVIEADLSYYMAHSQLAVIYSAAGAWDQALAERKAALDVNPDDPTLLVDYARTLIRAGQPGEAEAPLAEAGQLNPRDALAPYLLGQVLEKLDRTDDARTAYVRFVAIAPLSYATQCAELRNRLGL
jgi:Flp pilus assembly protein TadD